jgi:hypothetical protein
MSKKKKGAKISDAIFSCLNLLSVANFCTKMLNILGIFDESQ